MKALSVVAAATALRNHLIGHGSTSKRRYDRPCQGAQHSLPSLLLLVLMLCVAPAQAQEACGANLTDGGQNCSIEGGGEAGGERTASRPGSAPAGLLPQSTVGNPISLFTGNQQQSETDFLIPGTALEFERTYNSTNTDHNVGIGQGWHHSYSVVLFDVGQGVREIVQSDGRRLRFEPAGVDDEGRELLRSDAPNEGRVILTDDGQHKWQLPDGRTLRFHGSFLVEIDWPDQRNLNFFYRQRRLASVTDETGRVLKFDYTPGERGLVGYDQEAFRTQPGHLKRVTLPDGSQIHYDYDELKNLTRVRYADGTNRTYHYENDSWPSALTGLTDRAKVHFATWKYDKEGRAISSEHAGGVEKVTLDYPDKKTADSGARVETVVTNSLDQQSTYAWRRPTPESEPQLLSATGPGCATCPPTGIKYSYDAEGRLTKANQAGQGTATDPRQTDYAYDSQGRIAEIRHTDATGQNQLVERRVYEKDSLLPSKRIYPSVNPEGERRVEIERNARGAPTTITERGWVPWVTVSGESGAPSGSGLTTPSIDPDTPVQEYRRFERSTRLRYDDGRLVALDGPRKDVKDVTRLDWDDQGRLVAIAEPASPTLRFTAFDAQGQVTEARLGPQSPYQIQHDAAGRVTAITHRGVTVRYRYDAENRLSSYTDADGHRTRLSRDPAGRLTRTTDPFGRRTEVAFDSESRRQRSTVFGVDDALIQSLALAFDAKGRVSRRDEERVIDAGGEPMTRQTEIERDATGEISGTRDGASGARFAIAMESMNRIGSLTTPDGSTTRYHFDALGQEAGVEDARGSRTWRLRDDAGQIVATLSPDTGVERLERDGQGNVAVRVREDSAATRYVRDAAGRALGRIAADGTETRWRYDARHGLVTRATVGGIEDRFVYDDEAELIEHARTLVRLTFTTRYERDTRGRLTRRIMPDGTELAYRYHASGPAAGTLASIERVTLLGLLSESIVDEVDVQARDGRTGWTTLDGRRTTLRHNPDGPVRSLTTPGLQSLHYQRDAAGHIVSQRDAGNTHRYTYRAGHLVGADTSAGQYRYRYDAVGNRLERQEQHRDGSEIAERYTYATDAAGLADGNRLLSQSDTRDGTERRWDYNAGGSPIRTGDNLRYTYDTERRPTSVSRDGKLIARYAYNAFGERVKREVFDADGSSTVTWFLYDGKRITGEADGQGAVTAQYVYLDATRPIAKLEGDRSYAIHGDHLGTPRRMTDEAGTIVWSARHEPFGEAVVLLESARLELRQPGQYNDRETGTYYNYYRDYDAALGRYLTSDPIGLAGGLNTYLYANANPLSLIDPLGERIVLIDRALDTGSIPVPGRHMIIVLIPDRPEDFRGPFDFGGDVGPLDMEDLGNGEQGFVLGAQQSKEGRLEVIPFFPADFYAVKDHFNPAFSQPPEDRPWSPNATACQISSTTDDTAAIGALLGNTATYIANEDRLNIPYPGNAEQFGGNQGYVNSNSWALSALDSAGVVPDETNVPGMDQLSGNRLDPDYFTVNPDISDLTAENTNTNYCQVWDFEKKSCLSSPTDDRDLDALDDDDDGDGVRDDSDNHPRDPSRS